MIATSLPKDYNYLSYFTSLTTTRSHVKLQPYNSNKGHSYSQIISDPQHVLSS